MAEPAVKPERKKRGAKTTANPTDRRGKNMEKVKERMRILLAKGRQKENEELEEALKKEEALKAQEVKAQASKIENRMLLFICSIEKISLLQNSSSKFIALSPKSTILI